MQVGPPVGFGVPQPPAGFAPVMLAGVAIAAVVVTYLTPALEDFYKLLWMVDAMKDHKASGYDENLIKTSILPSSNYATGIFGVPIGTPASLTLGGRQQTKENLEAFLIQQIPGTNTITINPAIKPGVSYQYQDFIPSAAETIKDYCTRIQTFLHPDNNIALIVDTSIHLDEIIVNYPLRGADPTNFIYAYVREMEMDPAEKMKADKLSSDIWKNRFYVEEPTINDQVVIYPAYIDTVNPAQKHLYDKTNRLSDFYCKYPVMLRFTSKNVKDPVKQNLNVAMSYIKKDVAGNDQIVHVEEGANKAGGMMKLTNTKNGINLNNTKEITTIAKHHGDVGQALAKFRNIIVKNFTNPAPYNIKNLKDYKIAFCTYDENAALKALAEGVDIVFSYTIGSKTLRIFKNNNISKPEEVLNSKWANLLQQATNLQNSIKSYFGKYDALINNREEFIRLAKKSLGRYFFPLNDLKTGTVDIDKLFVNAYIACLIQATQISRLTRNLLDKNLKRANIEPTAAQNGILISIIDDLKKKPKTDAEYTRILGLWNANLASFKIQLPVELLQKPLVIKNTTEGFLLYSFYTIDIEQDIIYELQLRDGTCEPTGVTRRRIGNLWSTINLKYRPSQVYVSNKGRIGTTFNTSYGISLLSHAFDKLYNYDPQMGTLFIKNLIVSFKIYDRLLTMIGFSNDLKFDILNSGLILSGVYDKLNYADLMAEVQADILRPFSNVAEIGPVILPNGYANPIYITTQTNLKIVKDAEAILRNKKTAALKAKRDARQSSIFLQSGGDQTAVAPALPWQPNYFNGQSKTGFNEYGNPVASTGNTENYISSRYHTTRYPTSRYPTTRYTEQAGNTGIMPNSEMNLSISVQSMSQMPEITHEQYLIFEQEVDELLSVFGYYMSLINNENIANYSYFYELIEQTNEDRSIFNNQVIKNDKDLGTYFTYIKQKEIIKGEEIMKGGAKYFPNAPIDEVSCAIKPSSLSYLTYDNSQIINSISLAEAALPEPSKDYTQIGIKLQKSAGEVLNIYNFLEIVNSDGAIRGFVDDVFKTDIISIDHEFSFLEVEFGQLKLQIERFLSLRVNSIPRATDRMKALYDRLALLEQIKNILIYDEDIEGSEQLANDVKQKLKSIQKYISGAKKLESRRKKTMNHKGMLVPVGPPSSAKPTSLPTEAEGKLKRRNVTVNLLRGKRGALLQKGRKLGLKGGSRRRTVKQRRRRQQLRTVKTQKRRLIKRGKTAKRR